MENVWGYGFESKTAYENSLISILTNYTSEQEELLLKFISDPIVRGVDVNRNGLEIEVKDFKEVIIECMMDPNKRNWKDRVVIHLSNKK